MSPRRYLPDGEEPMTEQRADPAQETSTPPATTDSAPVSETGTVEQVDEMLTQRAAQAAALAAEIARQALDAQAAKTPAKAQVTHVVVSGDTLSGIAAQYYDNAGKWPKIYEANKDIIGDNPNIIYVGQELVIPEL